MIDIQYYNYRRTWSITSLPGLVFRRRRAVFILLSMPPPSLERATLGLWCGWFKPRLEIRHAAVLTTGAKHWHRQKAIFLCFCFSPTSFYPLNHFIGIAPTKNLKAVVWNESNTRLSASTISNIEYLLTCWSGRGRRRCLGGQVCVDLQSQSWSRFPPWQCHGGFEYCGA